MVVHMDLTQTHTTVSREAMCVFRDNYVYAENPTANKTSSPRRGPKAFCPHYQFSQNHVVKEINLILVYPAKTPSKNLGCDCNYLHANLQMKAFVVSVTGEHKTWSKLKRMKT